MRPNLTPVASNIALRKGGCGRSLRSFAGAEKRFTGPIDENDLDWWHPLRR